MRRASRVDDNQHQIDAALRKAGAEVVPMSGDPLIGFDRLVAFRGCLYAVEVKDGSKPPCKRKLTEREKMRVEQLARVGVTLHVVETIEQALAVIGAVEV